MVTTRWLDAQHYKFGIYYHVNALKPGIRNKKAAKADVAEALFLHVDIDDANALDKLRSFQPQPTVTVFSGGGYQCLWRIEPTTDLAAVEQINIADRPAIFEAMTVN